MQIIEFIREGIALLAPLYGEQEAKAISLRLLQEVAGLNNYVHLTEPKAQFGIAVERRLQDALKELSTGRPLQYVLGYEWFMGHKFRVCEGVLIPRPETEELVRHILKQQVAPTGEAGVMLPESVTVLDVCTGSGCIAWSLAAGFGASAVVFGCDISNRALEVASKQEISGMQEIALSGRAGDLHSKSPLFFLCDVLREDADEVIATAAAEKFDIIVSNPPYVCDSERIMMHKNVLDFEPELALFVPDTDPLLFYRKITAMATRLLNPGGKLYFEINERFGMQVLECMQQEGLSGCCILKDIHGKDRFAEGVLLF